MGRINCTICRSKEIRILGIVFVVAILLVSLFNSWFAASIFKGKFLQTFFLQKAERIVLSERTLDAYTATNNTDITINKA